MHGQSLRPFLVAHAAYLLRPHKSCCQPLRMFSCATLPAFSLLLKPLNPDHGSTGEAGGWQQQGWAEPAGKRGAGVTAAGVTWV